MSFFAALPFIQAGTSGLKYLLDRQKMNKTNRANEQALQTANLQSAISQSGRAPRQFQANLQEFKPGAMSNFLGAVGTAAGLAQTGKALYDQGQRAAAEHAWKQGMRTGAGQASQDFIRDATEQPWGQTPAADVASQYGAGIPKGMSEMTVSAPRDRSLSEAVGYASTANDFANDATARAAQGGAGSASLLKMLRDEKSALTLAEAIKQNPRLYGSLPAEAKAKMLVPYFESGGDMGALGVPMPQGQRDKINAMGSILGMLNSYRKWATDNKGLIGPWDANTTVLPGSRSKRALGLQLQEALAPMIYRAWQTGVMTETDYKNVMKQVPDLGEYEGSFFNKLDAIEGITYKILMGTLERQSSEGYQSFGMDDFTDPAQRARFKLYERRGY